ncbi:cytochrome c maturation protein CcmE [Elioraea rosea]|uniref:cytochrome c maturation protein CcmE n=1 Tax=Elioraea rosea TaxID=2492390 RepID=UPI0011838941|nr:cytochrome c maturation protein CcmE [Elioraea rosea]
MTRKRRRMWIVLLCGLGLGTAAALTLTAFEDSIVFFHSPSDLAEKQVPPGRNIRIGGLVEAGSVSRATDGDRMQTAFRVTDGAASLRVTYRGILPDLFREGQGVVAEGALAPDGSFRASTVLARHDETYMPPEVADALKRAGHWQPGEPPPPAREWNTLQPASAGADTRRATN